MQLRQHRVKTALRCLDCYQQGFLFLDLAHPDSWLILYASPEAVEQTGKTAAPSHFITKVHVWWWHRRAGLVTAGC